MQVTELNITNLFRVIPIGEAFAKLANYPGGFNFNAFRNVWSSLFVAGLGKIFVIETETGEVAGALGAVFAPDGFSGAKTATEQWWFVHPEHRNSKAGAILWGTFEEHAKKIGCKKLLMTHMIGEGLPNLSALYEKRGYRLVDQTFQKLLMEDK